MVNKNKIFSLSPTFSEKRERHSIHASVVPRFPGTVPPLIVHRLCAQHFLQLLTNLFETLQAFSPWSEDVHVVWT